MQKMQVREFQPVGHVQLHAEREILRDFPHFEGGSFFFPLTLKTITYEDQHRQNQFLTTYALQWRSLKEIRNSTARLTGLEIKFIIDAAVCKNDIIEDESSFLCFWVL